MWPASSRALDWVVPTLGLSVMTPGEVSTNIGSCHLCFPRGSVLSKVPGDSEGQPCFEVPGRSPLTCLLSRWMCISCWLVGGEVCMHRRVRWGLPKDLG